jgi:hypothetical protein
MKADPTIDAIREIRHQISASVDHDAKKLVEHYRKLQQRHPDRILSRRIDQTNPEVEKAA